MMSVTVLLFPPLGITEVYVLEYAENWQLIDFCAGLALFLSCIAWQDGCNITRE